MRRFVPFILLLAVLGAGCAAPSFPDLPGTISGAWSGRVMEPGSPREVEVTFTPDGGGSLVVPAEGPDATPVQDVGVRDGVVTFTVPDLPGDVRFEGALGAGSIDGTWTRAGEELPLVLEPGSLRPGPDRPQEPRPPFPYRVEEVGFDSGDIAVGGALTVPDGDGPFPAVVLISDRGTRDRDATQSTHRTFRVLADALTRAGYAVLRTDGRGVGGTGGFVEDTGYPQLAGDVAAGAEFLRARPEIDGGRIGLLGHGEGGYLAPLAAPDAGAAFAILLASPAMDGAAATELEARERPAASEASLGEVEESRTLRRRHLELIRTGDDDGIRALWRAWFEKQRAAGPGEQLEDPAELAERFVPGPYRRSYLLHDPAPSLRALDVPVLAVYGGRDPQVPAARNEPLMRDLLSANPVATVRTFPGLNHLMQPAGTGDPDEYTRIPTTIDPEVLDAVADWLDEYVGS
ncbi:alpha/beta hydrolase [Pseudonocardia nematodicida]|uniref:Alpha/beta hydrolase n=1 Tax=Pseudonocardia nematodicida TaxID=1206997 RepID=A0ABV1KFP2_9PSEU